MNKKKYKIRTDFSILDKEGSVNVNKLSGDFYYSSDTFITGSAGGAFATPTSITYTNAGITTPLIQNLYRANCSESKNV